jgi:hypothetical protein
VISSVGFPADSSALRHIFSATNFKNGEVCTGFGRGNLRERDHWGDPDVDGRII